METKNTFGWYLQQRGYDMLEVHKQYLKRIGSDQVFIFDFYKQAYPEEFMAWKTKQRILGDETT